MATVDDSTRIAALNFSSGTTGKIKACMITHYNFVANSEQTLHLDRMSQARAKESDQTMHYVHCIFSAFSHASKSQS